jgi:hypothetical protein
MAKANETQYLILEQVSWALSSWANSNDISSPTHTGDMIDRFDLELGDVLSDEQVVKLQRALLEIWRVVQAAK